MNHGRIVFSQLVAFLPSRDFRRLVEKYSDNKCVKNLPCWDQYLCMMFAQLTHRESLRDIETCLTSIGRKVYHIGISGKVSRSTLADANNRRNWKIYRDFANLLIKEARTLYINEPFGIELKNTVNAFNASIINLCLSVFPWAEYKQTQARIKLHTQIDLCGNIPVFIDISEAIKADVVALDKLVLKPGAIYILDRAYVDFARLYRFTTHAAFFIVRAKKGLAFKRIYSNPIDKTTGIRSDQTIMLTYDKSIKNYSEKLRPIHCYDEKTDRYLIFLTNSFILPTSTVADLYKCRWQVGLFFKWIKQHLRIKSFWGKFKNAVYAQIWIAISTYVLVAIVKKRLRVDKSLYLILQFLSVALFEKTPILQAFQRINDVDIQPNSSNQLNLFEY